MARPKFTDRFDRDYFDRYYRNKRHRVFTPAERARRAAMTITAAEYVLGRPVRSVLDVGAGEGHWRAPILRLRPRARYVGLDPSEYVVQRFGRTRGIRLGSVEDLGALQFRSPFDVVLAVGFLNYLTPARLQRALSRLVPLIGGVALLELYTRDDPLTGDIDHYHLRSAAATRRMLATVGLAPIGCHLYVTAAAKDQLAELETG